MLILVTSSHFHRFLRVLFALKNELRLVLLYVDEINFLFRKAFTSFGVKVKRDYVVFSIVFQIGPYIGIPLERARRELSIDMAVCRSIWKTCENTLIWSHFHFTPNGVNPIPIYNQPIPKMGVGVP